jgi:hypothetical protein
MCSCRIRSVVGDAAHVQWKLNKTAFLEISLENDAAAKTKWYKQNNNRKRKQPDTKTPLREPISPSSRRIISWILPTLVVVIWPLFPFSIPPQGSVSIFHRVECSQAAAAAVFSFIALSSEIFGFRSRITASWPPIRLPNARSSLAPNANLLRFSVFSWVGTNLCFSSFLFSSFSSPSSISLISCCADADDKDVFTVLATDGAVLYVLNRVDARLDDSYHKRWHR